VNSDVVIRPAGLDEFDCIARMRDAMALEEGLTWNRDHPGWQARFAQFFADKQARGDAQVFLAAIGDDVVGMGAFSVLDEYRATALGQPRGWVNSVFVVRPYRRRGIARRLMEAGIEWLRGRGCIKARLRTSDDGEALYASLGFVRGRELELDL
jgi:GNAT superfamily N-acetyltransferase